VWTKVMNNDHFDLTLKVAGSRASVREPALAE
jgi:hypothetical protein